MSGLRRFVAVANGKYVTARALERAVPDSNAVAEVLRDRHDFDPVVLADLTQGALLDGLQEVLAPGALQGGKLILLWTGHGRRGPGELQLLGRARAGDVEVATPAKLAEWSTQTGADEVVVLLDVCFAGGGVPDAIGRAHAVLEQRAGGARGSFGIFTASRPDEPALSGAFAGALLRLLTDGPADRDLGRAWITAGRYVGADKLFEALGRDEEWQARQTPDQALYGQQGGTVLHNPKFPKELVEGVVEHLVVAARSSSTPDANFFVGRREPLRRVVGWLAARQPGVLLITGPPAGGKSALLGRIVSLSDPEERARILAAQAVPAELDPGVDRIDVHLLARSLRVEQATERLCLRLGLPDASIYALLQEAQRRRQDGEPLVLAVDGLDEAGPLDAPKLATDLLVPLAKEAMVLVASRRLLGVEDAETMLTHPGRETVTVDLGTDPAATLADVREYVVRRLEGKSPDMDAAAVAEEIVEIARGEAGQDGPFLLARLLTSQLRAAPVDTTAATWRDQLARSVGAAIEDDLAHTVLEVPGKQQPPTAARELMTALACAYGEGFPAEDDVWPAVATALSPTGSTYGRAEVSALLAAFGRHIVAGRMRDQTVFRIAHQRLVEHLLDAREAGQVERLTPAVATAVAESVDGAYRHLLDAGQAPDAHAYLWFYAWRHLADAGGSGLDMLRVLVRRDRDAFLPDLAMALDRVASRELAAGQMEPAVEHREEVVHILRELEPGGGLDVVMALFDHAMVLATAGESEEANSVADEGTRMAWRFIDEPNGAYVVSAALVARALARRNVGEFEAAVRSAAEAEAILGLQVAADADLNRPLSAARTLHAESLLMLGEIEDAGAAADGAVDAADAVREAGLDLVLVEALGIQTRSQLALWQTWKGAGDPELPEPPLSAAPRLLQLLESGRPDGTLAELLTADAIRFVVVTQLAGGGAVPGLPAIDQLRAPLARSIALSRGYATASAMGATVYAAAVQLQIGLGWDDPDDGAEAAEAALTPFAEENAVAAGLLGQFSFRRAQDAALPDQERIDHARRAATTLSGFSVQEIQLTRYHALVLATQLAMGIGDRAQALDALEEATDALESCLPPPPNRDLLLGGVLAERAFMLAEGRGLEAFTVGKRAVDLLESALPAGALGLAQALQTVGVAATILGRDEEAAACWSRSVSVLEDDPRPEARFLRGVALGMAVESRLQAGSVDDELVRDAEAAVEQLAGGLADLAINRRVWPLAQLRLARVLHAMGRADAAAAARAAAPRFAELLGGDARETVLNLAFAMVPRGAPIPDVLLAELDLGPAVLADLRLLQERAPEELADTVADLAAAVASAEGPWRNILRDAARVRRHADPERFDRLWAEEVAGPVPPWLTIDSAGGHVVVAWLNTETWEASRAFLAAHPELLEASTEVHLDELVEEEQRPMLEVHLEILRAARAGDPGPVFDRLLAEPFVEAWAQATDPIGFLAEFESRVPRPALAAAIAQRDDLPLHQAVLALFAGGERALAIRVHTERVPWRDLLQAAWRAADPSRLLALATLCAASERSSDEELALAEIALAVARARAGRTDEAVEGLRSRLPMPAEVIEGWRDVVTDTIEHVPEQAVALATLLKALRDGGSHNQTQ